MAESYIKDIDTLMELLVLCDDLQTEKDGVNRPRFGDHSIDRSKVLDQFARDISKSSTYVMSLYKLIPMMNDLAALGRKLEAKGKIQVEGGDDYSRAALDFFLQQNGIEKSH